MHTLVPLRLFSLARCALAILTPASVMQNLAPLPASRKNPFLPNIGWGAHFTEDFQGQGERQYGSSHCPSLCESLSHGSLWPCSCPRGIPPSLHFPTQVHNLGQPFSQFRTDTSLGREGFCLVSVSLFGLEEHGLDLQGPCFLTYGCCLYLFPFHFSELFQGEMSSYLTRLFLRSLAPWVMSSRDTLDSILLGVRSARGRPGPHVL